ncbi:MAG TPA: CPXCG motif-containing cysteine-rich protein [Steroidobacteraceae bacterium]|nr:CPXCG motif-containing cysteine-rich protein [Steroidobacteraceae bacterium]
MDELYGLEPVIEPGDGDPASGGSASLQARTVQCPYCGESFETVVDLSSGSASYIEDCQVCCRPMEVRLDVRDDATLAALETQRSD